VGVPAAPDAQSALVEPLTPREQEVLLLVCQGLSNEEIADQLVISIHTIKKHTGNIYGKLGVTHRAQAVARAHELGLVHD
jgi:ATP/maltotriose-dependent transcriptional regulator MalT